VALGAEDKPFILSGAVAFDEGGRFLRQSASALHSQRAKPEER
jgi:hypothetical protein